MTFTSVGNLGVGASSVSSTSFNATTAATLTAGNIGILAVVTDNTTTTDGNTSDHSTVTDSSGAVSWTKLYEYTNGESAAEAGVTTSLWLRPRQGSDLASGSTVTITLGTARVDKTASSWQFTCSADPTQAASAVGTLVDAANGFGSASFSSLPSKEYLFFRACGKEANVASTSDLTASTGFSTITAQRSRNNAAAVLVRGEWRIVTATGETSNPTFAFSGDAASIFVALEEPTTAAAPAPIIQSPSSSAALRRRRRLLRPTTQMLMPSVPVSGASNPTMIAEPGSFTLTGNAAGLRVARRLTASTGTFVLTGNDTTLTYSGGGGPTHYTLTADTGTFVLTGNAAALRVARRITASPGGYTLTGNAAGLRVARQLIAQTGSYTLTGRAAGLTVARRLVAQAGSFVLTGVAATLTYSGALSSLGQYLITLLGLERWLLTDRTVTRYVITEDPMSTVTTASTYLWLTEDQEAEFEFNRKNATTGVLEAASGLTGMTVHIAATAGGSAIGSLTFNLSERGNTGIYYAVLDTATLVAGLSTSSYPDGTAVYLVVSKSGDIASRSFRKIVKRQRVGDG